MGWQANNLSGSADDICNGDGYKRTRPFTGLDCWAKSSFSTRTCQHHLGNLAQVAMLPRRVSRDLTRTSMPTGRCIQVSFTLVLATVNRPRRRMVVTVRFSTLTREKVFGSEECFGTDERPAKYWVIRLPSRLKDRS